jgi:hypothetical protein
MRSGKILFRKYFLSLFANIHLNFHKKSLNFLVKYQTKYSKETQYILTFRQHKILRCFN